MTSTFAIAIAFSLLIYDISWLNKHSHIINEEHLESELVFLLAICLLLPRFPLLPSLKCISFLPDIITLLVEIPLSLNMLEISIVHVWKPLKEYLLHYSDDILEHLHQDPQFEWLICTLCCGKSDCSDIFARLVLKAMSFVFLLTIALITK